MKYLLITWKSETRRFRYAALSIATAFGAGCVEQPTAPIRQNALVSSAQASSQASIDAEWASISQGQVPGFAGHYIDSNGDPIVLLVDTSRSTIARQYVSELRAAARLPLRVPRIRQVKYRFEQLAAWRESLLTAIARTNSAVSIDIDEVNNRVAVGVRLQTAISDLRVVGRNSGIPDDALYLSIEPEMVYRATLSDVASIKRGGMMVSAEIHDRGCTLGFNAEWNSKRVLVTNSHCSATINVLDSARIRQGPFLSSPFVGFEVSDVLYPQGYYYQGGQTWICGGACRFADASVYEYYGSASAQRGEIARTTYATSGASGSVTIDASNPVFAVGAQGNSTYMLYGMIVDKMGATTGWTRGTINGTCVGVKVEDIWYMCQYKANLYNDAGDSGAPVFLSTTTWDPPPPNIMVHLFGVFFSGPAGANSWGYFSPIDGIEREHGSLNVCAAPNDC